jgi:DNA-binding transcriptional LysR family regulator
VRYDGKTLGIPPEPVKCLVFMAVWEKLIGTATMSDLRNFDLNLLVAFDVLMRELNVSRAAEKMFVTQSTMSHILQRLRQQLDDPVLVRTNAGMKPSERAVALVEPVRAILRNVEQVIRPPAEFDPKSSRHRFVIHATDYIEVLLLPPLMARLGTSAPGIDIHFKRTEAAFPTGDLENGDMDVVLGFEAVLKPPVQFRCEKLFDDRMVCVVREDHPEVGSSLTLDEYLALPHMLISRTGIATGLIDDWLAEHGRERRIALVVSHFLSAPLILSGTNMVLSFPKRIAEQFARLAHLKTVPVPIDLPPYNLVMIWHPLNDKEPAHAWLRRQILEICAELCGEGATP